MNEIDPTKDFSLSEHFSFFELTKTTNEALQEHNRVDAIAYLPTLRSLASFLEKIRDGRPLAVNSAFRSSTLNKATKGSSPTSQHPMGQACDFHRPGLDPHATFLETLELLKAKKLPFGQLIDESADRGFKNADGTEAISRWVHVSLGHDFWKPERCGEVLRKWDENGEPHYQLLEKVHQEVA
jgi:hypothetical protein